MKVIDMRQSIFQLISNYPELKDILSKLGFTEITKPGMVSTVGRFMNLKQGCSLRKIDIKTLIAGLETEGFILKEDL